jgi:N-acetylglucosaminyldiphosphoundecaprenol N-acetyl-beta-D-mannosaminyltransferase
MHKKSLINFSVSIGSYSSFTDYIIALACQDKSSIVCVANVHMFVEAHKDPKFLEIINNADLITPDGLPLIWALQIFHQVKQERVAGMDLLPDLLHRMELQNISAYFYGGTEPMLSNTETYLKSKYPELKIAGFHSPPFGENHDQNVEEKEIITQINNSYPSVVFVILGCPKQEKWMAAMKDKIHTVMIGIGGALPVMLGMRKRAPVWMQNKGLEWLFRLSQEPRRLFGRYISTNSFFLWIFLKEYVRVKIFAPLGFSKTTG